MSDYTRSPLDIHEPTRAQSYPEVTSHHVSFDLRDHIVDGIGRGSAQDLRFRPNAHFHPIREVQREGHLCRLQFDKPLTEITRPITHEELSRTLQALRQGLRECALGQQLYLYPGIESFALSASGELRMILMNVRPQHRFIDYNVQHMSVIAFLELARACSPDVWKTLQPHVTQIKTLATLERHLETPSVISKVFGALHALIMIALWLLVISIPLAFFGPPSVRAPLRQALHPVLERASELMRPESDTIDPTDPADSSDSSDPSGSQSSSRPVDSMRSAEAPVKSAEASVDSPAPLRADPLPDPLPDQDDAIGGSLPQ